MNEFQFDQEFIKNYHRFWLDKTISKMINYPDYSFENRAFPDYNDDDNDEPREDPEVRKIIIEKFGCTMKLYGGHGFDLIFREHILEIKTPSTHLFWQWFVECSEDIFITPMRRTLHNLIKHVGGDTLVFFEGYPVCERVLYAKDVKLDSLIEQLRKNYNTSNQRYYKRGEPVNIKYLIDDVM